MPRVVSTATVANATPNGFSIEELVAPIGIWETHVVITLTAAKP